MENLFLKNRVIKAVLSSPLSALQKVTARAVDGYYQLSIHKNNQDFHQNYPATQIFFHFSQYLKDFKQCHLYTEEELHHYLWNKERKETVIKKKLKSPLIKKPHNLEKNYPFLKQLGVDRDKSIQINKFLEILAPYLDRCTHIIDFGCGKAYLTFALAHLFKGKITGIDLKGDLLEKLQAMAGGQFPHLLFEKGKILDAEHQADGVIALHACNTATDEAIYQGIRMGAELIVVAPCCHQELYSQIDSEPLKPMLRHGILRERLASLATDAARAELLTEWGYKTDVIEFIDAEHTPKNLIIRAVKTGNWKSKGSYRKFADSLAITPYLEKLLDSFQAAIRASNSGLRTNSASGK